MQAKASYTIVIRAIKQMPILPYGKGGPSNRSKKTKQKETPSLFWHSFIFRNLFRMFAIPEKELYREYEFCAIKTGCKP